MDSVTAAALDGVCPHGYAEDPQLDGRVWEALHVSHALARSGELPTIRLGKRAEKRAPKIREFAPLADLNDLVFAAWDPIPDDAYTAAVKAGVLEGKHLEPIAPFLKGIQPLPAAFDQHYVKRLHGTNVKAGKTKRELAEALRKDIRDFKAHNRCDRHGAFTFRPRAGNARRRVGLYSSGGRLQSM